MGSKPSKSNNKKKKQTHFSALIDDEKDCNKSSLSSSSPPPPPPGDDVELAEIAAKKKIEKEETAMFNNKKHAFCSALKKWCNCEDEDDKTVQKQCIRTTLKDLLEKYYIQTNTDPRMRRKIEKAVEKGTMHVMNTLVRKTNENAEGNNDDTIDNLYAILRFINDECGSSDSGFAAGDIRDVIRHKIEAEKVLHKACVAGDMRLVRFLCEEIGVDPNFRSADMVTPLHMAVVMGQLDVVRYLVTDLQVDVNKKTLKGVTPFMDACMLNFVHVAEFLIKQGKCCTDWKIQETNCFKCGDFKITLKLNSSLHAAITRGFDQLIDMLMDNNVIDVTDLTWIMLKSFEEKTKDKEKEKKYDLEYFLTKGGKDKINEKYKSNTIEILEWYKNKDIKTILDLAVHLGDEDIVRLLLDHGAQLYHRENGNTIHIAQHNRHNKIVKLLSEHFGYA